MAMLTHSMLVRALMFAFSFINRSTKVLALTDGDAAFDSWVSIARNAAARRVRRELEAELGVALKAQSSVLASRRWLFCGSVASAVLDRRLEEDRLPDRDLAASNHGAVDPGLVVAHPNDRFQ